MDTLIKQAEQLLYSTVQLPVLRKTATTTLTAASPYYTFPTDFLYPISLAVIVASNYSYLVFVDETFMREAYPNPATTGVPAHYGYYSSTQFIVGPTPTSNYSIDLHYGYQPESIVTALTTWLGDHFDSALLNGTLVQALRFMKGEKDMVELYDKLYLQAVTLLKQLGDGKMRQDMYRMGQVRVPVS